MKDFHCSCERIQDYTKKQVFYRKTLEIGQDWKKTCSEAVLMLGGCEWESLKLFCAEEKKICTCKANVRHPRVK